MLDFLQSLSDPASTLRSGCSRLLEFEKKMVTEDGSTDTVPRIFYGQYLILGVFGSYMF